MGWYIIDFNDDLVLNNTIFKLNHRWVEEIYVNNAKSQSVFKRIYISAVWGYGVYYSFISFLISFLPML